MKLISLTQGKCAKVDDEDYDFLNQWKWYAHFKDGWYAIRNTSIKENKNGKRSAIKLHRLIMGVTNPKIQVDHRDGDGLNCQRSNLRKCSNKQNASNRNAKRGGTSPYLGVAWKKNNNKWCAQIRSNNKSIHIGLYIDQQEAARAYDKKALELHGEFANLNFK